MTSEYNLHFVVEGQDFGRGRIAAVPTDCHTDTQWSFAFVCPLCGRLWAQAGITDAGWRGNWVFPQAICSRHPEVDWCVAGSLWKTPYYDLIASFPPPILARELLLHLDFMERFDSATQET